MSQAALLHQLVVLFLPVGGAGVVFFVDYGFGFYHFGALGELESAYCLFKCGNVRV